MVKYKFKIGDKVKLRQDLVKGQSYGKLTFLGNDMKFKGVREIVLRTMNKDTGYTSFRFGKDGFCYTPQMLEKVGEELKFNEDQYTKGLTKEMVKQVEGIVFDIVKKDCVNR